MRKPLIAGNWKMNGSVSQVDKLLQGVVQDASTYADIDILVLPTYLHLSQARDLLANTNVLFGAQNLYPADSGAYTGEVSGIMLKDMGCEYVLIGHSERRTLFNEALGIVAEKFKVAAMSGLKPILCVGETQEEREENRTEEVILAQLQSAVDLAGIDAFKHAVIAYEPVWAIGTGLTATPEQAQAVHAFIRQYLAQNQVDIAETMRILYGGSMKPANAASLLAMPDIDGGLIGGASLVANDFITICAAAQKELTTAS